jgi:trans-aconitate methyltransferase
MANKSDSERKEIKYQVSHKVVEDFNNRYLKGYMTAPRVVEKKRIAEVVQSLQLQDEGTVIDFGCGKGEFTILLKGLLPGWRVLGVDISDIAVTLAKEKYTNLEFYTFDEYNKRSKDLQANFIFSHHVLEYVPDIHYVLRQLKLMSHPDCAMLHIVPCNNGCGLEYSIASRVINGINPLNGLYFFEHHAHVQRYTEAKVSEIASQFGYILEKTWYVDQHWGAIEWITRSDVNFVKRLTRFSSGTSKGAVLRLLVLRFYFLLIFLMRYPFFNLSKAKRKKDWSLLRRCFYFVCLMLYYPSHIVNRLLLFRVDLEWRLLKFDRCGGKMYLLFRQ